MIARGRQQDRTRVGATVAGGSRSLSNAVAILFLIAISAFSSTTAESGFDEAVASYKAANYTDAFKEWSKAAQEGDIDAQYNLGCLYIRGEGVAKNKAWAADWFQRAADQGDLDADTWLLFSSGPTTDERRKEYFSRKRTPIEKFRITFVVQLSDGKMHRRTCSTDEKDGAFIAFDLGLNYETGTAGFPQDDKQAAAWYRRASERNYADAQTKLAYLYAAGRGVERNQIEAARLFRKAAEQGNVVALDNLGAIYASGIFGRTQDLILGYVLVSHASELGSKLVDLPAIKALLSPAQLQEGQRLIEKWKGNVPWPPEIAERLGPPD
jgi:TPR repeat protein